MTVTEHVDPIMALMSAAPRRRTHDEPLSVDGVIPSGLDGAFVQASRYPGGSWQPHAASGPVLFSGVRLGGGTARRLTTAGEFGGHPLERMPDLATWIRPAGPAAPPPDGPWSVSLAPPVQDRATAEWHTIATYPGLGCAEHLTIGTDGGIRDARSFALDGAPLMHAVALTDRFVVVFDLPVTYHRAAAMIGTRFPYRWRRDRPARIGLLSRRSGDATEPRWFPIDPCYVSHSVNAYDDGGRVVVDAVRHERAFDGPSRGCEGAAGSPRVHRWTLDLGSGAAEERPLVDSMTLASVDSRRAGRRHQLMFGCAPGGRALVGHDLAAGSTQVRELEPGRHAGQPVFVPRGRAEGDGWLVVLTQNDTRRRSELLVLDALHLNGRPQAVVHLPALLPAARHTTWMTTPAGPARGW